jgi:hypothetical protein
VWSTTSLEDKEEMALILPDFIEQYLHFEFLRSYNRSILSSLKVPPDEVETILRDTHVEYEPGEFRFVNPVVKPIKHLLRQAGVLEHPKMGEAFLERKLL